MFLLHSSFLLPSFPRLCAAFSEVVLLTVLVPNGWLVFCFSRVVPPQLLLWARLLPVSVGTLAASRMVAHCRHLRLGPRH